MSDDDQPSTHTEKGASLARGPALALGTILLAAGLYLLYKQHIFPPFSHFPNGHATGRGKVIFKIFAANGWTGMLTAVAGGLLLFGAAQHLLAKTMSLIVGIALAAAAIIAAISGRVLGMAAANVWTEIAWGACAAVLLFNTVIPRRRNEVEDDRGSVERRPSPPPPPRRQPPLVEDDQQTGARSSRLRRVRRPQGSEASDAPTTQTAAGAAQGPQPPAESSDRTT